MSAEATSKAGSFFPTGKFTSTGLDVTAGWLVLGQSIQQAPAVLGVHQYTQQ